MIIYFGIFWLEKDWIIFTARGPERRQCFVSRQGCIPSNEAPHSLCTLLLPSFHPCLAMFGCAYAFPCIRPIYRSSSSGAITSPNFRLSFKFSDPGGQCSKSVHFIRSSIFSHSPPPRTCFLFKKRNTQEDKWFFSFLFLNLARKRINFFSQMDFFLFLPRNRSGISANRQILGWGTSLVLRRNDSAECFCNGRLTRVKSLIIASDRIISPVKVGYHRVLLCF